MSQYNNRKVRRVDALGWSVYFRGGAKCNLRNKIPNCGKWMYFFNKDEFEIAQNACKNAIKNHVVVECKHTDLDIVTITNSGVCCFYCNGYNKQEMKWVIKFMLENDLIRKTKSGRLYNISFKFDTQTHMGQYGEDFHAQIKLSDFVDLNTGAFL